MTADRYASYANIRIDNDLTTLPSNENQHPWICARRTGDSYPKGDQERGGTWLLRALHANEALNTLWLRCVPALDAGLLGRTMKVSTLRLVERDGAAPRQGVICIYTYDYRDKQDVRRIAEALEHSCGVTQPIYYKPDLYMNQLIYSGAGGPAHLYSYLRGEWREQPLRPPHTIFVSVAEAKARRLRILSRDVDEYGRLTGMVKAQNPELP